MMHTAIDANALGSGRGGDETLLNGILRGLATVAQDRDRYDVYAPVDAPLPTGVVGHPAFTRVGVPRVGGLRRFGVTLPRLLAAARPRPDLVLSLTHAPLTSTVPSALLVTDLSFHRHPDHYPLPARVRLNQLVPRQSRQAAVVVTISEFCRADLLDAYGLDADRVRVVPCAIDPPVDLDDAANERVQAWARRTGVDRPFVLYLGNLHHRKNVPRLILAFLEAQRTGELTDHQLVIAGASWWGHGAERSAAAAAPEGTVLMTGPVEDEQREWLLRRARALAYVSIFEGFGLPPLEAMARGTPVVASNATSIPEVVGDAAILVDPMSVEDIARGLVTAVSDEGRRAELRRRGVARAETYSAERTGRLAREALDAAVQVRATVVA